MSEQENTQDAQEQPTPEGYAKHIARVTVSRVLLQDTGTPTTVSEGIPSDLSD